MKISYSTGLFSCKWKESTSFLFFLATWMQLKVSNVILVLTTFKETNYNWSTKLT